MAEIVDVTHQHQCDLDFLGQRYSQGAPQGTQDQTRGPHRPEKGFYSHSSEDPETS